MKKFTTIISILLCLSLILATVSLVACNRDEGGEKDGEETTEPVDKSTILTVGVVLSDAPYIYQKEDKVVGVCVDVLSNIALFLNRTLEIEIVDDKDTLAAGVKDGTYDAALLNSDYPFSTDVKDYLIFTDGFVENRQTVVVKSGSSIASVADLDGKKVAVKAGTSTETAVKEKYGDNAIAYATNEEAFTAVKNGTVDAFIADMVAVSAYDMETNDLTFLYEDFSNTLYTLFVYTDNVQLRSDINMAINSVTGPALLDPICNHYILDAVTKD